MMRVINDVHINNINVGGSFKPITHTTESGGAVLQDAPHNGYGGVNYGVGRATD